MSDASGTHYDFFSGPKIFENFFQKPRVTSLHALSKTSIAVHATERYQTTLNRLKARAEKILQNRIFCRVEPAEMNSK